MRSRALGRGVAAVGVLLVFTAFAGAAALTWTGAGGDNLYATPGNWDGGAAPYTTTFLSRQIVLPDATPTSPTALTISGTSYGGGVLITASHDVTVAGSGSSYWNHDSNATLTIAPADGQAHTYTIGGLSQFPQANSGDGFHDTTYDVGGTSKLILNTAISLSSPNNFNKNGTGTFQYGNAGAAAMNLTCTNFNINAGVVDMQSNYYAYFTPSAGGMTIKIASAAALWISLNPISNNGAANMLTFTGGGRIMMNSKLDGSGTKKNWGGTLGSTFAPGTDGTAGLFTINGGSMTFSAYTTTPRYNTLKIDIIGSGTVAGADFDQLSTDCTLSGLSTVDLVVNGTGAVAGNSYTFLTSANNIASQSFRSVVVNNTALPYTVSPIASNLGYQISFTPEPCMLGLLGIGSLIALRRRA